MIKGVSSPRKTPSRGEAPPKGSTGIGSGKVQRSPATTPRTPRKIDAGSKPLSRKVTKEITDKVEVMELPARLAAASANSINLKITSSGDRVRNGTSADSCMRLPLDCMSKEEIKDEMKDSNLSYHHLNYHENDDDAVEEEEQAEYNDEKMTTILAPDKARFNIWKGTNYDLHLLGDFKSDFERRVKSFQRPETQTISMDPFCRSESGLQDEPPNGDAFLVWKSSKLDQWKQHSNPTSQHDVTLATLMSSEEEEDDEHESDTDSLPDPELTTYIHKQKKKLKEGLSVTGETLFYDDEFEVIRNLHRESHSLTNYGTMPDEMWIGKANIFYPEMSAEEKKMLNAVVSRKDTSLANI